jgi:hypothetical protein
MRMFREKILFCIAVSAILYLANCQTPVPDGPGKEKLEELNALAHEIPMHPSFRKVDQHSGAKIETAFVDYGFKSDAKYEDIKGFYTDKLAEKEWKLLSEKGETDWFSDLGGKSLFFRKGDIYLTIQYAGAGSSYGWDYGISLSWGLYND